jgi:anti-sigma regulatory factor (Ser/Thr protein kinase)
MGRPKTRTFVVRNRLQDLGPLAAALGAFCREGGLSDDEFGDVRLALEEAVSNTIRHGYLDAGLHEIRIRAAMKAGRLSLEIVDDARAFNPLAPPLPDVSVPIEEKNPGGLGLLLLRSVMDRVDYRRKGGRNHLRLVRSLRRP